MAAIFNLAGEGLKRVTGILPANQQYVTTTWWFYMSQVPNTGTKHTLYMVSNSADRANQSIIIAQDDTSYVRLYVAGVAYGGIPIRSGWHSVGIRRRPTSNFIDFDIDNDSIPAGTATVTFSGWTFDEEYLGLDPRDTVNPVMQVSGFRQWSAFLTYVEEWKFATPVQTTGLETNTPLVDDLLDDTDNHNDWTIVGAVTFVPEPTSNVGSMGGWWLQGTIPITSPEAILRAQLVDVLGGTSARIIAFIRLNDLGSITVGDLITDAHWEVRLYYGSGPAVADVTDAGAVTDPYPDPRVGLSGPSYPARDGWAIKTRWAIAWKCSTYDSATGTYAADGYVKLFMNGDTTPLIQAVDVTIPRKVDGFGIQYSISPMIDGDRMWARTVVDVPATNVEGAFTSGTPSDLVYFDDFDGGSIANWTVTELFPITSGATPEPNVYDNCGGDNGYGISTWQFKPDSTVTTEDYLPYSGLYRYQRFPPYIPSTVTPPVEPPDKSGIYYVNPQKVTKHDSYYGDVEAKIPDPTIRTGLLGD